MTAPRPPRSGEAGQLPLHCADLGAVARGGITGVERRQGSRARVLRVNERAACCCYEYVCPGMGIRNAVRVAAGLRVIRRWCQASNSGFEHREISGVAVGYYSPMLRKRHSDAVRERSAARVASYVLGAADHGCQDVVLLAVREQEHGAVVGGGETLNAGVTAGGKDEALAIERAIGMTGIALRAFVGARQLHRYADPRPIGSHHWIHGRSHASVEEVGRAGKSGEGSRIAIDREPEDGGLSACLSCGRRFARSLKELAGGVSRNSHCS